MVFEQRPIVSGKQVALGEEQCVVISQRDPPHKSSSSSLCYKTFIVEM